MISIDNGDFHAFDCSPPLCSDSRFPAFVRANNYIQRAL